MRVPKLDKNMDWLPVIGQKVTPIINMRVFKSGEQYTVNKILKCECGAINITLSECPTPSQGFFSCSSCENKLLKFGYSHFYGGGSRYFAPFEEYNQGLYEQIKQELNLENVTS